MTDPGGKILKHNLILLWIIETQPHFFIWLQRNQKVEIVFHNILAYESCFLRYSLIQACLRIVLLYNAQKMQQETREYDFSGK